MEHILSKRQSFKSPDIAEKYLQLKDHDKLGMLEDIAYVSPKQKHHVFSVNAYKYDHGSHNLAIMGFAALFVLFFPFSMLIGAVSSFALFIAIISAYCALTIMREEKRDFNIEESHPEIAVYDNGIWFFRYNTFIPYDRFFRFWVTKKYGLQGVRQVMFEIYMNNEDLENVIERREMLGYEKYYIENNRHHKTKLNNVLSIRLPYRDGGMDYTHDEIVEKISGLINRNAYENALPVDIGIEKQTQLSA